MGGAPGGTRQADVQASGGTPGVLEHDGHPLDRPRHCPQVAREVQDQPVQREEELLGVSRLARQAQAGREGTRGHPGLARVGHRAERPVQEAEHFVSQAAPETVPGQAQEVPEGQDPQTGKGLQGFGSQLRTGQGEQRQAFPQTAFVHQHFRPACARQQPGTARRGGHRQDGPIPHPRQTRRHRAPKRIDPAEEVQAAPHFQEESASGHQAYKRRELYGPTTYITYCFFFRAPVPLQDPQVRRQGPGRRQAQSGADPEGAGALVDGDEAPAPSPAFHHGEGRPRRRDPAEQVQRQVRQIGREPEHRWYTLTRRAPAGCRRDPAPGI